MSKDGSTQPGWRQWSHSGWRGEVSKGGSSHPGWRQWSHRGWRGEVSKGGSSHPGWRRWSHSFREILDPPAWLETSGVPVGGAVTSLSPGSFAPWV